MPPKYNLKVFKTANALNKAAAKFIVAIADKAIAKHGKFTLSLSGGQTPQQLYALLAEPSFREQVQWEKTFIFWGDERCVPFDDERNNAHQVKITLLSKINIPLSNIHFIPVNLSPAEAAANYEKEIIAFFGTALPQFDLILLGLGKNGHTASLFPDTKVISEQVAGVRPVYIKKEKIFRVTMTAPLINQAHQILFMVTGKEKAEILKKVLTVSYLPAQYPAQLINSPEGNLFWFADQAAASLITIKKLNLKSESVIKQTKMKKVKEVQKATIHKAAAENKGIAKVKSSNSTAKKANIGAEEFEEDRSTNIRMKPQPLTQSAKKSRK